MEVLKHKSLVPFMHMAVCVAQGCYYMTRRTKHTAPQYRCDGQISPWPQAVVYLSHKNSPQPLKVRGCRVQKVTLKTKIRQVFLYIEPLIQGHRVKTSKEEREVFVVLLLTINWKCTLTESCGERLETSILSSWDQEAIFLLWACLHLHMRANSL